MFQSKKVKIISLILAVFVVINGYLLLKQNDIILKKYYANEALFASQYTHTKELEKNAVVTTAQTQYIAAPVQAISEVTVSKGQSVQALGELAIYKEEQANDEIDRLQARVSAYETELSELNRIVTDLEYEGGYSSPSANTDSTSVGDSEFWNLDLSIELGIEQNTPTAEGVAIIKRTIAETQREIDILNATISQIDLNNSLVTPIEGFVEDIILEGDSITFKIQSATKKLVVYVDQNEWKEIEPNQHASAILREGEDDELTVEGTVIEKQEIPARESIAFDEMRKHEKINPDETIYEVSIEPFDMLLSTPVGEFAKATIITNEVANSYEVPADWIVKHEVENVGDYHIYTIGYDGKTRLEPVTVEFEHTTELSEEWVEDDILPEDDLFVDEEPMEEEVIEEPKAPRIITVDLADEDTEDANRDEQLQKAKVFTASLEGNQIFLSGDEKNIMAPVFRPYPLRPYEWDHVGDVSWRNVLFFLLP